MSVCSKVGTLVETLEAQAKWTQWKSKEEMWEMRRAARKAARLEATRKIQSKVELVSPSLSLSLSRYQSSSSASSTLEHCSQFQYFSSLSIQTFL
jgi:hypothetical protein